MKGNSILLSAILLLFAFKGYSINTNLTYMDSIRIKIGDTIRVENPTKEKSVEIVLDDLKEIFGIQHKDSTQRPKEQNKVIIIEKDQLENDTIKVEDELEFDRIIGMTQKTEKKQYVKVKSGMMDLGFNNWRDNTDYNSLQTNQAMSGVPENARNSSFLDLRQGKSINVNIWPVIVSYVLKPNPNQRFLISSGIGLQIYNFRLEQPVSFNETMQPFVYKDSLNFSKNKLSVMYASIPLLFTGQSRMSGKYWLTYGAGLIGGYKISSWTKQVSANYGKEKQYFSYNLNPYQVSITGELGIKRILRLFAVYQLTNLWQDGLEHHPFSIGIRFFGI